MSETYREAIAEAEKMAVGEIAPDRCTFEELLADPGLIEAGEDAARAYLAVLLDAVGFRDEAVRILRDYPDAGTPGTNAALRNAEGVLVARHGEYQQARDILRAALPAARSPSLRVKILANLAAVSRQAGWLNQAAEWSDQASAIEALEDPAAAALLASVRAGISVTRNDEAGLRDATASLDRASASWAAGLDHDHVQGLVILANVAAAEMALALAESSSARLDRAVTVLEAAALRLAGELGADHPRSLAAAANLAGAGLNVALASGSAQQLTQAIAGAEIVNRRISIALGAASPEGLQLSECLAAARARLARAQHLTARLARLVGRRHLRPGLPTSLHHLEDAPDPRSRVARQTRKLWAGDRGTEKATRIKARYLATITAVAAAAVVAIIAGTLTTPGEINTNNGNVAVGASINGYNSTASGGTLSNDPQARIVQLTGSFSELGFVDAIVDRDPSIVGLYLKSGMTATTLYEGASSILFGFQGAPNQNGDPVALIKTFQAGGFKVDDELEDSDLLQKLTDNFFPAPFDTGLAPKGYTGGYESGQFVGSLLFWIVQRALYAGPTGQDIQVIEYLISQGADCKIPLSFMKFNSNTLAGTSPYEELLPMMQTCAK